MNKTSVHQDSQLRQPAATKRYPLHIHLSFVITLLILLTGTGIIWLNYHESSKAIELSAEELYQRTERDIVSQVSKAIGPVETMLSLAADTQLPAAATREERRKRIPFLAKMLSQSSVLSSFYIGYGNGDFFIMRRIHSQELKVLFNAPAETAYMVQSIERTARGGAEGRNEFLDRNLQILDSRPQEGTLLDPRTRPWYQRARESDRMVFIDPYPFFATGEIGATLALRASDPDIVLGADVSLSVLSEVLTDQKATPSSELVLFDQQGNVIAYSNRTVLTQKVTAESPSARASRLDELGAPVMSHLAAALKAGLQPGKISFELSGSRWVGSLKKRSFPGGSFFYYAILIPHDELLAGPLRTRMFSLLLAGVILAITVPLGWWISRRISGSLRQLESEAHAIQRFSFRESVNVDSAIQEINNLAIATESMKATIRDFLGVTTALAAEDNFTRLMNRIVDDTLHLTNADAGVLLLMNDDNSAVLPAEVRWRADGPHEIVLPACSFTRTDDDTEDMDVLRKAALTSQTVHALISRDDAAPTAHYLKDYFAATGIQTAAILTVPLLNRDKALVGILALIENSAGSENRDGIRNPDRISFIEALSGYAAVSIETQQLIKAQKELLEALIRLLAGAIDAKSPYTGGHCQRVPVIAGMLAEAAVAATDGPYRDFRMSDQERELLHIASWLHDCGKITTPEYVVDKATKLETIHDRIHEIRMRFEVLKRDAGIEYWQRLSDGGNRAELKKELLARLAELDEEFAFVALCNEGGEYLDPAKTERLKTIASRTWLRTLDDGIGISEEEKIRKQHSPAGDLPVTEQLLSDREEHLFTRSDRDRISRENPWGFKLEEPSYLYNRGELHNLAISRGTLTPEERHKINDHIVRTIVMLSELPFPKHLRNVPEVAGGHHEKVDGTGYPKKLKGDEMSPLARMLAVADIFEALTATDRPYKQGKKLSEALKIMSFMVKDKHIDADLFALFLASGVYRKYADAYLKADQIDDVDISMYLPKR